MDSNQFKTLRSIKKILLIFILFFGFCCLLSALMLFVIKQELYLGFLYCFLPLSAVALFFEVLPMQLKFSRMSSEKEDTSQFKKPLSHINVATLICILGFLGIFIFHALNKAFFCGSALALFLFSFLIIVFHLLINHLLEILDYEREKNTPDSN